MARKEHHVVPNKNSGWSVKRENSSRSSVNTRTKREAVRQGRELSKNAGSELIVHGRDGKIQNSDSHGNDPCPPRDTR